MSLNSFKHFRILELLGKGGMGEVYLALDTTLERKVALKFLPRDLLRDPSAQGRLLDEARSVSRVQHPNIAVVHSIEEDGGIYAICMEYVEGVTLKQLMRKGPVPLNQIARIGHETAAGMQAAHDMGIVHRDLKPANIMITRRGQVKIMDFGLALRPERVVNTMGPNTYGTVQYMSPEQARGEKLTAASDIFSFGSTFYELISGRPPFNGSNDLSILHAIINSEPSPLREHRRDVPPALEQMVRGCMAKAPQSRWSSMAAIAEELRYVEPTVEAGPRDLISELSTGLAESKQPRAHAPANLGRVGRRASAPGVQTPSTPPTATDLGIDLPEGFVVHEVRGRSGSGRPASGRVPSGRPAAGRPASGRASAGRGAAETSRPVNLSGLHTERTGEIPTRRTTPPSVLGPELPLGPTHSRELRLQSTAEQWTDVANGAQDAAARERSIAREAARRAQLSKPVRPISGGSPRASGPTPSRPQPSPFRDLQDEADHLVSIGRRGRHRPGGTSWSSLVWPALVALLLVAAAGYGLFRRAGVEPALPNVPVLQRGSTPASSPDEASTSRPPRPLESAGVPAGADSAGTRAGAVAAADSARTLIQRWLDFGG